MIVIILYAVLLIIFISLLIYFVFYDTKSGTTSSTATTATFKTGEQSRPVQYNPNGDRLGEYSWQGCRDHMGNYVDWNKSRKIVNKGQHRLHQNYLSAPNTMFPGTYLMNNYKCKDPRDGKMKTGVHTAFDEIQFKKWKEKGYTGGGTEVWSFDYTKCKDNKVELHWVPRDPNDPETDPLKVDLGWEYACYVEPPPDADCVNKTDYAACDFQTTGKICNPISQTCDAGCNIDLQCSYGRDDNICVTNPTGKNRCSVVPDECNRHDDCGSKRNCIGGKCENITCSETAKCSDGLVCVDDKCTDKCDVEMCNFDPSHTHLPRTCQENNECSQWIKK